MSENAVDNVNLAENFSQGKPIADAGSVEKPDYLTGDVASGLERLRKRLLDLSKSNRLLNFRYYARSTLRVIDELPDQLFENFINGGVSILEPVPLPVKAKEKLSFWKEHKHLLDTPDQLEKLRNEREIPIPPVEAYARWKGIRVDYELPQKTDETNSRKHQDNKIQTLLYPKDLQAVAARLSSLSRTAVEETGSNMLFLSFGFLEWTDDDNSEKSFLAPLLLLPVQLERQKKSRDGMFRYALSYSGEDLQVNLSLQEKLKEFAIDLPDLKIENEMPEKYWAKVQRIIRNKPNWKIRRHIILSILQFGKQLLYLDIDPERWPVKNNIIDHPLVKRFFLGGEDVGLEFAQEYDVDNLEGNAANIPLITDADSSQHSVIIDALQGRNLVVEGPPGTGKSQTITNMIGSALAGGKKVLFVAEKLAALEVVRRRLNEAGLGDFTLELHSHKTQKGALVTDLENRLKKRGQFKVPSELDGELKKLHAKRDELKRYTEYLHTEIGGIELSPFSLFHKATRYKRSVLEKCPALEGIAKKWDEKFSAERYFQRLEALRILLRSIKTIERESGSVNKSPWFGLNKPDLRVRDRSSILDAFQALHSIFDECRDEVVKLSYLIGQEVGNRSDIYESLVDLESQLALLPKMPEWSVVNKLYDEENINQLEGFLLQVQKYEECLSRFHEHFEGETYLINDDQQYLEEAFNIASQILSPKSLLSHSDEILDKISSIYGILSKTEQEWKNCLELFGLPDALTVETLELLKVIIELSSTAPQDKLNYRSNVFDEDVDQLLESMSDEIDLLKNQKFKLDLSFSGYEDLPQSQILEAASILENSSVTRFFAPKWWKARGLFKSTLKGEYPKGGSISELLLEIADFKEKKQALEANEEYREVWQDLFKGLDTDIVGLKALREWYKAVRAKLGFGFSLAARSADKILEMEVSTLKSLSRLQQYGLAGKGEEVLSALNWCLEHLNRELDPKEELTTLVEDIKNSAAKLRSLIVGLPVKLKSTSITSEQYRFAMEAGIEARNLENEINKNEFAKDILGEVFSGVSTDANKVNIAINFARKLNEILILDSIREAIFKSSTPEIIVQLIKWSNSAVPKLKNFIEDSEKIAQDYYLDQVHWFKDSNGVRDYEHFRECLKNAMALPTLLSDWITYKRNRERVDNLGLSRLVKLVEQGDLAKEDAENGLAFLTYYPHADRLAVNDQFLSGLNGDFLDELRSSFKSLDSKIQDLNKRGIAGRLDVLKVPSGVQGPRVKDKTELSLINHIVTKPKSRVTIRQLIKRAGRSLQVLKPCWMMGPLSVAQYIPAGELEFDLLIMDEASQMKPEDAIGCIARAKQVIIVGDPKQLPPTNFFNRTVEAEEDEDDTSEVEEAESILDAAIPIFQPARRLRWHYRSQSEDLISFSNKYFYNNDLVVFPSPTTRSEDKGISFEYVPKATCRKGKNPVEARYVAKRAIEFMESGTANSLGIVALNSAQQQLIEDEFYRLLQKSPLAEVYLERRAQGSERFFIKNLENVQGDERDVMMISFTYGPDPDSGKVMNRFGPITGETGWRRLNVLFTRAKKRIISISSMRSDDIKLAINAKKGLVALKNFLAYAETGQLETSTHTGEAPDSDFEIAIAEALSSRGYECVAQLGVAGYFLDLAVKHPDQDDGFILGIECDGATYHSAKSVRDRDRLRQLVLERMGWKIERIWSTDWFEDSERQVEKICERIETLRERDRLRREKQEQKALKAQKPKETINKSENFEPENANKQKPDQDTKERANLSSSLKNGRISIEEAKDKLIDLRENVIYVECPDSDRSKGLLRNEMIECLLETLPTNGDEFLQFVPPHLRGDAIDLNQFRKYSQRVFDILAEVDC